jgi:GDP-D-mannose dehydratase
VHRAVRDRRNWRKFGDVAGQSAGLEPNVSYADHQVVKLRLDGQKEEDKAEVEELLGDNTKAKKELGWTSKYSFDELVREMVENDCK